MPLAPGRIEVVRVGALQPLLLTELVADMARLLGVPVSIAADVVMPDLAYDPRRRQYLASLLLEAVLGTPSGEGTLRLGIADVDLFLPVFTHLCGYALLGGAGGIVSIHRLRPQFSGDPADGPLLRARLLKESLHEIGHSLGLVHCPASWCVMHPSRGAEELDLRDAAYCGACASQGGLDGMAVDDLATWLMPPHASRQGGRNEGS